MQIFAQQNPAGHACPENLDKTRKLRLALQQHLATLEQQREPEIVKGVVHVAADVVPKVLQKGGTQARATPANPADGYRRPRGFSMMVFHDLAHSPEGSRG
jgi:hypothetical protein